MEQERSSEHDGNLIIPVIGDMNFRYGKVYFNSQEDTNLIELDGDKVLPPMYRKVVANERLEMGAPRFITDKDEELVSEAKEDLSSLVPEEVFNILMEGRINASLLINSPGGCVGAGKNIKNSLEFIKINRGRIATFCGSEASSAAANLFMQAPKGRRHYSENSKLMFHLSDTSEFEDNEELKEMTTELLEILKKQEINNIINILLKDVPNGAFGELREVIIEAFRSPESPDCPIRFKGNDIKKFGLAKRSKNIQGEVLKFHQIAPEQVIGSRLWGVFMTFDGEYLMRRLLHP